MNNGFYLLYSGCYPDQYGSYAWTKYKKDIEPLHPGLGMDPAVHVFDGSRQPWNELDPYPDFVVEHGPRGGIKWARS